MNDHDLGPPDPALLGLLREACEAYEQPPVQNAPERVFFRLTGSVAAFPPGVGADAPDTVGDAQLPAAPSLAPSAAAVAGSSTTLAAHLKAALVAAFVVGTGAGAGAYAVVDRGAPSQSALLPSQPSVPLVVASVPVQAVAPADAGQDLGVPDAGAPRSMVAISPPSAPTVGSRDEDLASERTLLDMARASLARGNMQAAGDMLDRHSRQFPRGRLSEERDVLRIQVLAAQGNIEEARKRQAAFRKAYPDSITSPAVDPAAASTPW